MRGYCRNKYSYVTCEEPFLSQELYDCVAELKKKEVSDSVKKNIAEYGF